MLPMSTPVASARRCAAAASRSSCSRTSSLTRASRSARRARRSASWSSTSARRRAQLLLVAERLGAVVLDLAGERGDARLQLLDAGHGVAVGLADLLEVVDLRVDLGEVRDPEDDVEHGEAAVLVDVGHALAEHRAGHVELRLRAQEVGAHGDELGVEVVEPGAGEVVLLDGDLGPVVQACDLLAHLCRLSASRGQVGGRRRRRGIGDGGGSEGERDHERREDDGDRRRHAASGDWRALLEGSLHGLTHCIG